MYTPTSNPRVRRALFTSSTPRKKARSAEVRVGRRTGETKYNTIEGPWLSSATQGLAISPSTISQGDNVANRDGLKINCLRLTGMLVSDGTGPFRVVVYCPKDPAAEIAATTAFSSVNPADHWVLHDKVYYTTDSSSQCHLNLPLNHTIHWSSGTSDAWRRNPVKIFLYKARTTGNLVGHFRLYFKDP